MEIKKTRIIGLYHALILILHDYFQVRHRLAEILPEAIH